MCSKKIRQFSTDQDSSIKKFYGRGKEDALSMVLCAIAFSLIMLYAIIYSGKIAVFGVMTVLADAVMIFIIVTSLRMGIYVENGDIYYIKRIKKHKLNCKNVKAVLITKKQTSGKYNIDIKKKGQQLYSVHLLNAKLNANDLIYGDVTTRTNKKTIVTVDYCPEIYDLIYKHILCYGNVEVTDVYNVIET